MERKRLFGNTEEAVNKFSVCTKHFHMDPNLIILLSCDFIAMTAGGWDIERDFIREDFESLSV